MTEIFAAPTLPEIMPGESAESYLRLKLLPALAQTMGRLQQIAEDRDPPVPDKYTVTNLTESRTLDCNGAAIGDLADVVGTMLKDFQVKGFVKGTSI